MIRSGQALTAFAVTVAALALPAGPTSVYAQRESAPGGAPAPLPPARFRQLPEAEGTEPAAVRRVRPAVSASHRLLAAVNVRSEWTVVAGRRDAYHSMRR